MLASPARTWVQSSATRTRRGRPRPPRIPSAPALLLTSRSARASQARPRLGGWLPCSGPSATAGVGRRRDGAVRHTAQPRRSAVSPARRSRSGGPYRATGRYGTHIMRVLLFGTYDTSMHPRVATIAEGLRARGADVAECNAPLGLDTAARVDMLAHPWRAPALLARLARRWTTLTVAARRMPAPDAVVVGYLGHFDVHLARRCSAGCRWCSTTSSAPATPRGTGGWTAARARSCCE